MTILANDPGADLVIEPDELGLIVLSEHPELRIEDVLEQ